MEDIRTHGLLCHVAIWRKFSQSSLWQSWKPFRRMGQNDKKGQKAFVLLQGGCWIPRLLTICASQCHWCSHRATIAALQPLNAAGRPFIRAIHGTRWQLRGSKNRNEREMMIIDNRQQTNAVFSTSQVLVERAGFVSLCYCRIPRDCVESLHEEGQWP